MLRDRLKESFFLKAISYIILPILILIIIASSLITMYYIEYPEIEDKKEFYETEIFSNLYTNRMLSIYTSIDSITNSNNYYNIYDYDYDVHDTNIIYEEEKEYELTEKNEEGTKLEVVNTDKDGIYYSTRFSGSGIKYLILNKSDNYWYTNIDRTSKTDTVEEIKQELLLGTRYWNAKNKNIETNIENLTSENIMRGSIYEKILNNDIEIYTAYIQDEDKTYYADFAMSKDIYNFASKYYDVSNIALPISMILSIIIIIYLIVSCGHKKRRGRNTFRFIR